LTSEAPAASVGLTASRISVARDPDPATSTGPAFRVGSRRFEFAPHNCFACGQLNTHGLQLVLHGDADRCWTELTLPKRFEGWEGIAHGGILTAILDEVMAWALVGRDSWGLTARLSVDFRKPVAIGRPIRAEGRITEARRRLLKTHGQIVDAADGELLASAEAVYVAAPESRKRELKARYQFRLVDEPEVVDKTDRPGSDEERPR
jgi:acyl-coenzyme A thioesterase PaaI-like protein